jgi:hypothetical protein
MTFTGAIDADPMIVRGPCFVTIGMMLPITLSLLMQKTYAAIRIDDGWAGIECPGHWKVICN